MALTFRSLGPFTRLATAIGLTLVSGAVLAQDPKPPTTKAPAKPADPKAKALLEQVAKAYQALGSYSDQGEFVVSATIGDKIEKQTQPLKLTFVRPNKLDFDAGPVRLVSDGKTITTAVVPLKKFIAAAAPEKLSVETFRDGPTGAVLFGGPSGVPMYILINLLTADEPLKALEQLGGTLQFDPADPKGNTLLVDQVDGPDLRLAVDPAAKLFKSIDLVLDPKQLEQSARPASRSRSSAWDGARGPSRPPSPRIARSPMSPLRASPRLTRSSSPALETARSRSSRSTT